MKILDLVIYFPEEKMHSWKAGREPIEHDTSWHPTAEVSPVASSGKGESFIFAGTMILSS